MPQNKRTIVPVFIVVALVLGFALWGPECVALYRDRTGLNQITAEKIETGSEGYRYTLGNNEKLYILARCISSLDQQKQGTYAMVVNRQGPSEREMTKEDIYTACSEQLAELTRLGVLPNEVKPVTEASYDAVLYSAIDVLEPRNNLSVWKVSLSTNVKNADKMGRMLDAYIDAETGKIYEFYVRTQDSWEEMQPEQMVKSWAQYMELTEPEKFESDNPLLENTPYYEKYRFSGIGEESTVVTLGFYQGINELFLKVSK